MAITLRELVDQHRGKRSYGRIAKRAGITRQYLYLLIVGKRTPSTSVLRRLGRTLGVSWQEADAASTVTRN